MTKAGPLLETIEYPQDLRKLSEDQLAELCEDVRRFIIDSVSKNPGHLGASLGAVELAVAIHYVFNTPYDQVIWDVGHQAYAHKILTGRRKQFHTNRHLKGISGFPRMAESEYDSFGTGHSSTSISAALGMAIASQQQNKNDKRHIAVIGDGSLTGGMAFEALNHAGAGKANVLIILNDNNIAIDQNVGALKDYLTDITTSRAYNRFKDKIWRLLTVSRAIGRGLRWVIQKTGIAFKSTLLKESNLFESLNLRYFGPVDGHDIVRLVRILYDLKDIPGPKILHVLTVKGKGFKEAEKEQTLYHAPGLFDMNTGEIFTTPITRAMPPRYQDVFGQTIVELAEMNNKIVGVTPAMASGCSMNLMMEKMPERVFDVGIAEQHAVTFSAGLASQGMIPFCNIYSSFMQRAYDQVVHDVALQKMHVVFCLDRAGLVGEDGATHHGVFDMAYLRSVPGMIVSAPMNEEELRNLMFTAQNENNGPFSIRYPRGVGVMPEWKKPFQKIEIGKGRMLRDGNDIAIISIGHIGNKAAQACVEMEKEDISCAHYDLRFLKPLDEKMLHEIFCKFSKIITVEDGCLQGGMGSAILEFMSDHQYSAEIKRIGVPDHFIEHGTLAELHIICGMDSESIANAVREMLVKKKVVRL
ncbi:MAG: 1-deoxy-D-xylulose-5-phosphate synthase [Bacteroidota bacterium]